MAYTNNEKLPEIRARAVQLLNERWSTRKVARHLGYSQSVIVKWRKRASSSFPRIIETKSSRPKNSPKALDKELVGRILKARIETKRCSEVVYETLREEGVNISLSSVKRTLSRYGLLKKRSPWKKRRSYPERPDINTAGDMVEMDTIHVIDGNGRKTYVYTAIDLYSRYGFAILSEKANTYASSLFARRARRYFGFRIKVIQTDNGSEFGLYFSDSLKRAGIRHRHIHPRSPNENGHLERFNRTIQEEMPRHKLCILLPEDIRKYLKHYNETRMHMGIKYKRPAQLI